MGELQLPVESFPAWALLQHVEFDDVAIAQTPDKGYGLVSNNDLEQERIVLSVPKDLLLSVDQVDQYAKVDSNFRDLLEAFGQQVYSDNATYITESSYLLVSQNSGSAISVLTARQSQSKAARCQALYLNAVDGIYTIYTTLYTGAYHVGRG